MEDLNRVVDRGLDRLAKAGADKAHVEAAIREVA